MNYLTRSLALAGVALLGSQAFTQTVLQQDIVRSGTPSTVYGAYVLGETQAGNFVATRASGAYAISPHTLGLNAIAPVRASGQPRVLLPPNSTLFVGGISDGSLDTAGGTGFGGGFGQYDALGFTVSYNSFVPGRITVTRRVVADALGASDSTGSNFTGYINEMSMGGLSDGGDISLKLLISGQSTNSFGLINAAWPSTSVFTTSYSTPTNPNQWKQIAQSSVSDSIQSVGSANSWVWSSTFNKEIIAGSPTSTPLGAYTPHGRVVATITGATWDDRGSVTYNDRIGLAAVLRTKTKTVTNPNNGAQVNVAHCTAVAVYKVTFDANGNPELHDLAGNLSNDGTEITLPQGVATRTDTNSDTNSMDLVGTNYFGSTGFAGPAEISMNDHGDIALAAVAVNIDDVTDTGQNQERGYEADKRYIVNHFNGSNGYTGWVTAAQSGVNSESTDGSGNMFSNKGTGDFVTVNPGLPGPGSSAATIAVGNPSLDNNGNVYFQACYSAEEFAGGSGSTYHSAVFRSKTTDGINYTTEEVLAEEDTVQDPVTLAARRVTFMPLAVATSSLTNLNIRFPAGNSFGPTGAQRDGDGALVVACKLTDPADDPNNPTLPTRWTYILIRRR